MAARERGVGGGGTWTSGRVRFAGWAGIVAGLGLTVVAIVHNALGLEPEAAEPGASLEAASAVAHGVAYPLLLAPLLAALGIRRSWFGRVARAAAWVLASALAVLGAAFLVAGLALLGGARVDFDAWYLLPAAIGFAAMFAAAIVVGIALLLRRPGPRAVPALLVAPVPAAVLVTVLDAAGVVSLTAAAVEAPLYLAFAVLGYELLTGREGA